MNSLFLLLLIPFGYLALNLGADKRPGHHSYGFKPVLAIIIVMVIGLLIWPVVGPAFTSVLHSLGAVK